MKLALIRRKYNPFGGAERFLERLIRHLIINDVDVSLVAEQWPPEVAHQAALIPARAHGWSRRQRLLSFQSSVQRTLATHRFDLVQSHERLLGADIYRSGDGVHLAWVQRLLANAAGWTRKWIEHDGYHKNVIHIERQMASDARLHYVANSTLVRKEIQSLLQVPEERISLIPNGVDTHYFIPPSTQQREAAVGSFPGSRRQVAICFIGSGFKRKGVEELVLAMRYLPEATLRICGADRNLASIKGLIVKEGLDDRVQCTGPLSDVRRLLWASDIFALPSLYDPSPNAVLEALACGLPIVSTKDIGTADEILHSGAGVLCERNPESIAEALQNVARNLHLRNLSSRARSLSFSFDQNRIIQMWLDFYATQLARKK